jgi:hypothetical protein
MISDGLPYAYAKHRILLPELLPGLQSTTASFEVVAKAMPTCEVIHQCDQCTLCVDLAVNVCATHEAIASYGVA